MTAEQFNHILDMEAAAGAATAGPGGSAGAPAATPAGGNSGPPVIAINGVNPATIHVGATYVDLGATITGPQSDLNLGTKCSDCYSGSSRVIVGRYAFTFGSTHSCGARECVQATQRHDRRRRHPLRQTRRRQSSVQQSDRGVIHRSKTPHSTYATANSPCSSFK